MTSILRTLFTSAKATVSAKVLFNVEHTANLIFGSRIPLTNASVLKLSITVGFFLGMKAAYSESK